MGELNITAEERESLISIDLVELDELINRCLVVESVQPVRSLRLERCGEYVAARLRQYESALSEHGKAKAEKKRAETGHRAERAGSNLAHAVRQMKERREVEDQERELFYVDDQPPFMPSLLSEDISANVRYRWRRTTESEWMHGHITFVHKVDALHEHRSSVGRKVSRASQEKHRQETLYREWEHLWKLGLHALREYFRAGGDGALVPQKFQAKVDSYSRGLNNQSADFWGA
jgi:hypothetical protein